MPKSIIIEKFGSANQLKIVERKVPNLNPYQVLIRNKSIGLNYIDIYHRTGLYPVNLPATLGIESCGVIQAVGTKVLDYKEGQRVGTISTPLGAYSEFRAVDSKCLLSIPDDITNDIASAVMLKGLTADYLLKKIYKVKKGDTILFHAAAGGLGHIFCQLANQLGCTIIGTVGSDNKKIVAKNNGCHHVINYNKNYFVKEVEDIVGKNAVDVVYDSVGTKTFEGSIECLRIRGMMVLYGSSSGYVRKLDIAKHINSKSLFFTRPTIAHYTMNELELKESVKNVYNAIQKGCININIFKSFEFGNIKQAHHELENRTLMGPCIIKC